MNFQIEKLLLQNIVYMRRKGAYGVENFQLMAKMKDWVKQNNLWDDETTLLGIAQDNPATTSPENCRYDVCLVVQDGVSYTSEVENGTLPSGTYAIFKVVHTSEAVQQFYGAVFSVLEESGHTYDSSKPIIERYVSQLVDAGFCEFCVPILEK